MFRALILVFALNSAVAGTPDYEDFLKEGDDIVTSANEIIHNDLKRNGVLVWIGQVIDVSISKNEDGATSIEWFCEQYPLEKPLPTRLKEPLRVEGKSTGNFVLTLSLPNLSIEQAREKIADQLESPTWVLVRGEAVYVKPYKGIPAVYLHSLNAALSDTLEVHKGGR